MVDDFLIMVAQISATLMGFAFLGPMIQAVSSEFFTRSTYIDPGTFYKRFLAHKSFVIFVFFCPFLSSFLLLNSQIESMQMIIRIASIAFALIILLWYWLIIDPTRARPDYPKPVNFILWRIPRIVLLIYIFYTGVAFCCWTFASFVHWTAFVFIALCLLFLMDSTLTPIEAITFKTSELRLKFGEEVKEYFQNIRNALKAREDQVRRLESLRLHPDKEKEWHRKIAEYRSEIIFLREHLEGPEDKRFKGLKQDWEEIGEKLATKECQLSELCAFDDRKERLLKENLPEFERVTKEIELLLQRYGEEHESDK